MAAGDGAEDELGLQDVVEEKVEGGGVGGEVARGDS